MSCCCAVLVVHPAFVACHGGFPVRRVDQEVAAIDLGVGLAHDGVAAGTANHLLGAFAHAVALAGMAHNDLARGGEAETLLGPGLVLQFGHFCILSERNETFGAAGHALSPDRSLENAGL